MPTILIYVLAIGLCLAPGWSLCASGGGIQTARRAGVHPLRHVVCFAFSADESRMAVASTSDLILRGKSVLDVWNLDTDSVLRLALSNSPSSVAFFPHEEKIVVGSGWSTSANPSIAGRIECWDLSRKTQLWAWNTKPGVNRLSISGDAKWIAYGASRRRSFLLDATSGAMLLSFQHGPCAVGDCDAVTKLGFLVDHRRLFTVCGSLRLWTIVDSLKVCEVAGSGWGSDVNAVAFDKHNSLMAIAEFGSPNVTLIDESGTPPFHQLISLGSPSLREVLSLAFVDTGNMLAAAYRKKDGAIAVSKWDVVSCGEQTTFEVESSGPVAFSPSGRHMVAHDKKGVFVIDLKGR